MSSPTTAPRLVEGQRVQDLTRVERFGVVAAADEYLPYVSVLWDGTRCLDQVDAVAGLKPLRCPIGEIEDLNFPPPACPFDDTILDFDGGWNCPTCRAHWNENGADGDRACVVCHETATIIDVDGRLLCKTCAPPVQDGDA